MFTIGHIKDKKVKITYGLSFNNGYETTKGTVLRVLEGGVAYFIQLDTGELINTLYISKIELID